MNGGADSGARGGRAGGAGSAGGADPAGGGESTAFESVLTREECVALLGGQAHGRLVLTTPAGRPLIRPVNYVYDTRSGSVVFRTGRGTKFSALLRDAWSCFEIDAFEPTTGCGWSVIVTGITEPVTHAPDVARLDTLPLAPLASRRPHWFRLRARTVTGRRIEPVAG
ncbi:MAG TPA: pyridoxamine 5'-phosphate oxidase family protein [Solirubrobacteraceae bacterium]|nr:pyridoxamine 5'-phosphate oxidase family protein [Solirubrobacteraceae bacterium]